MIRLTNLIRIKNKLTSSSDLSKDVKDKVNAICNNGIKSKIPYQDIRNEIININIGNCEICGYPIFIGYQCPNKRIIGRYGNEKKIEDYNEYEMRHYLSWLKNRSKKIVLTEVFKIKTQF